MEGKMIRFKSKVQEYQFNCRDMCPYVFWKIHHLADRAERLYGLDLVITSVYRKDKSSHSDHPFRAVDIRVRWKGKRVLPMEIVRKLKAYHDSKMRKYGAYDSFFEHEVRDSRGRSRGAHVHCQRPKRITLT